MDKRVVMLALIASGLGAVAMAQQPGQPGEPGEPGQPGREAQPRPPGAEEELGVLPRFETVDANRDGSIDESESEMLSRMLQSAHDVEFEFASVDSDRSGSISNEEYVAYDSELKSRLGIA